MEVIFTKSVWEDFAYWRKIDQKKLEKIKKLIKLIKIISFSGEGKPEPLKFELKGFWSRRIDKEHRLIYRYKNELLEIISC